MFVYVFFNYPKGSLILFYSIYDVGTKRRDSIFGASCPQTILVFVLSPNRRMNEKTSLAISFYLIGRIFDLWVKSNQSLLRTQSFLGTTFKMAVSINIQLVADGSQEENEKFRQSPTLTLLLKRLIGCIKLNETFPDSRNRIFNLNEIFSAENFLEKVLIFQHRISSFHEKG